MNLSRKLEASLYSLLVAAAAYGSYTSIKCYNELDKNERAVYLTAEPERKPQNIVTLIPSDETEY